MEVYGYEGIKLCALIHSIDYTNNSGTDAHLPHFPSMNSSPHTKMKPIMNKGISSWLTKFKALCVSIAILSSSS